MQRSCALRLTRAGRSVTYKKNARPLGSQSQRHGLSPSQISLKYLLLAKYSWRKVAVKRFPAKFSRDSSGNVENVPLSTADSLKLKSISIIINEAII